MDDIKLFLKDRKNLTNFLVVLVLILGLPLGVNLVHNEQVFQSRADVQPVQFVGNNITQRNGQSVIVLPSDGSKASVGIQLTSPLGPSGQSQSTSLNTKSPNNLASLLQSVENKVIPTVQAQTSSTNCSVGSRFQSSYSSSDFWVVQSCGSFQSGECTSNSQCSSNNNDACYINPSTSNWCFGFANGQNGCMKLEHFDGSGNETQTGGSCNTGGTGNNNGTTAACQNRINITPATVNLGDTIHIDLVGVCTYPNNVDMTATGGLTNCTHTLITAACPTSNFDWQWTCTASAIGNFTATVVSNDNQSHQCPASQAFTVSQPNCNTGAQATGSCSAPANTCGTNNGSQANIFTAYTGGGSCTQVSAPNTSCSLNNCSSGTTCTNNSCVTNTPNCNSGIVCNSACSAASNACGTNSGTQSNCAYTTFSGGGSCVQQPAQNQQCTPTCASGTTCTNGTCTAPPTEVSICGASHTWADWNLIAEGAQIPSSSLDQGQLETAYIENHTPGCNPNAAPTAFTLSSPTLEPYPPAANPTAGTYGCFGENQPYVFLNWQSASTGSSPSITYQVMKNGAALGSPTSSLQLEDTALTPNSNVTYQVIATNVQGSSQSNSLTLNIPACQSAASTPSCNSGVVCSGACSASSNTCSAGNGVQNNCVFTTLSGGGSCNQTNAPSQTCSVNNCNSGSACVSGQCQQASISPSSNPSINPSVNPSITPTQSPVPVTTVSYQISDNILGIDSAPKQPYTADPVLFNYTFPDQTPGIKTVFVRFFSSDGKQSSILQQSILLVPPDPVIDKSISCNVDLTGQGVSFTIDGHNFGTDVGTVSVNGNNLTINDWSDTTVDADLPGLPQSQSASLFAVLTRKSDGQTVTSPPCKIGVSQIALNLSPICRSISSQTGGTISNVDFEAIENKVGGQQVHQKVSINSDGTISGLQAVLNQGEEYKISVKAPRSLRRTVTITGSSGTSVANFTLPLGDIFPLTVGDGQINTYDYGELTREWGNSGSGQAERPGDLNDDGVVNSVDYACMRLFFGEMDDPLPGPTVASSSASQSASQSQ